MLGNEGGGGGGVGGRGAVQYGEKAPLGRCRGAPSSLPARNCCWRRWKRQRRGGRVGPVDTALCGLVPIYRRWIFALHCGGSGLEAEGIIDIERRPGSAPFGSVREKPCNLYCRSSVGRRWNGPWSAPKSCMNPRPRDKQGVCVIVRNGGLSGTARK